MKNKYLVVALLLMFVGVINAKALVVGDCKVLASFKLSSSLDEEEYICKGKEYGNNLDSIYYSGEGNKISLNNANIYYFTNWDKYDVILNIAGNNNISLLHIADSNFKVTGSGSLKFKQNSFVKKVVNGESVYQYVYEDKLLLNNNKKIYEGTLIEFEENYELLKNENDLPDKYNLDDYSLVQVADYTKMTSVTVTDSWISKHIDTELKTFTSDGYGIVEYEKPKETSEEEKEKNTTDENKVLESDNVILISEEKLENKYQLKEEDLSEGEVAENISNTIDDKDLLSFYDVTVYNGKKIVSMKNGKYIIKIKLGDNKEQYADYQIIYVNDDGEIEEYIDGVIEGDYIVFETSHLSQYGVIATPVENVKAAVEVNPVNVSKSNNLDIIFKISLLLSIALATLALILFIVFKSGLLPKKKKRKRRLA